MTLTPEQRRHGIMLWKLKDADTALRYIIHVLSDTNELSLEPWYHMIQWSVVDCIDTLKVRFRDGRLETLYVTERICRVILC